MKLLAATLLTVTTATVAVAPAAARTVKGDCSMTVDGKVRLDLKRTCVIDLDADGSLSVGTRRPGSHFAYVSLSGDRTATVYWNEDRQETHAHSSLGDDFRRQGPCWINRRAKVCAQRR